MYAIVEEHNLENKPFLDKFQDNPEWWNSLDDEDQAYAMEIIVEYRKMLDEPYVEDLTLAQTVLKKYTLNG